MSIFNPHSAATGQITKIMEYAESETYRIENLELELGRAAADGKIETVKYLVDLGCRINVPDAVLYTHTPFHRAAARNQLTVLKYLMKIRSGFIEELIAAIEKLDVMGGDKLEDLGSLVISEEKREQMKIIRDLRRKILIRQNDQLLLSSTNIKKYQSPVFLAGQHGHVDVVKLLLKEESKDKKKGVRVMVSEHTLQDLDSIIMSEMDEETISVLRRQILIRDYKQHRSLVFLARHNDHIDVVKLFLNEEYHQRVLQEDLTALMRTAAASGNESMMCILLKPKHEINPDDVEKGKTMLSLAVQHGHDGVIRMLLRDDRVDKEFASKSNRGWTPVHIAAAHGRLGALKCLLASGCNSSPLNTKGETPLLLAVKEFFSWKNPSTRDKYIEYKKVIKFLIETGCDSEVRDNKNDNVVSYVLSEVERTNEAFVGKIILTLVFNKGYNLSGLTSTNREIQGLINKYFYPKFSSFLMARVPRYNHLMSEFPRETLERIHGFGTGKL